MQTLDYKHPVHHPPSRVLAFFAYATAAYPLLFLAAFYGQWLLSWWVLGHPPRLSLDDPKSIVGANWMHGVSFFALLGLLPAGCGAVALNTIYVVNHRDRPFRMFMHVTLGVALWLGTFALLRWDPGLVLYWWLD